MPALAALPDIAIALAGVILLCLAYAVWALRDFLVAGFSRVPVVGGWIAGRLGSALDAAATALTRGSAAAFGGAEHLLRACVTWTQSVTGWATHLFRDIVNTVIHIAYVQIPNASAVARRDTVGALDTARHLVSAALSAAEQDTARAFDTARHDTAAALSAAEQDTARAFDAARHGTAALADTVARDIAHAAAVAARDTTAAYDAAVAHADTAAAQVRADALSWVSQAEAAALGEVTAARAAAATALAAAAGGLVTDLEHWGDEAVATAWPDASQGIDALRRALGGNFPDLLKLLPLLEGAGAAGLVGALIRAIGGVHVLTNVLSDCVIPNCDNLSRLGQELKQLSSLPAAAAMLAFLVSAATDPVAAANDTVTVTAPLFDTVFAPLADLISAGAEKL